MIINRPDREQVLGFIRRYHETNGETPTHAELAAQFGLRSPASVHNIVRQLERQGRLTHVPHVARGLRIGETHK